MMKGTLEGIILAILQGKPSYGYEIRAKLQESGFTDIAEGTIYALLVRIEQHNLVDVTKVASPKGPPRKVYALNENGERYLSEFWSVWDFLSSKLADLRG
jgi:PadR family transcriptional regulator PadR